MDETIDRLLHACGLRSFAYRRYPPVRIEEPTRSAPLVEAQKVPEPEVAAVQAEAPEPFLPAPAVGLAEPSPMPPAQVTFLNPVRLRTPLPAASLPPEPAPSPAPQAVPRVAAPPILRRVDSRQPSPGPAAGDSGFPAVRAAPPAPSHPARRFALLDEVAAEIVPPRPVTMPHAAPVAPEPPPSQPPPAPPRLRLRRRARPAGES